MTDDGPVGPDGVEFPRHLGRYRIDGVLGAGGMGVVLSAHDPELDRTVAIKLLRREDSDAQEQLVAEAQAMARLRHVHVVSVHDVGVVDGRVFIAMEFVDGVTLREWLRAKPRSWRTIVSVMIASARGLAAAHAAGVVHRDFKLDNVLVGKDGGVRVADFGLSSSGREPDAPRVAGTPGYMAPEQHDGAVVDAAADQFAFAVSMWEALENARPFAGETREELAVAKKAGPPAAGSAAPRWVYSVLRRSLAVEVANRFPSMIAVVDALERGLGRRRRVVIAASAVALIAGTATTALALSPSQHGPDCSLASAAVDNAWNLAARNRITTTFSASTRPHARATIGRVDTALDQHAASLAAARVSTCKATHERGEQSAIALDRKMACLDRRIGEMTALIDLFSRADNDVVDKAYEAVAALRGPESCEDSTAVRSPPPIMIAAKVDAAERQRATAEALRVAGKLKDARAAFEQLATQVRPLAYAPLDADVENGLARTLGELGDAEAGIPAFQTAAAAAAAAGDDRLIADAWIGQLDLLGDAAGKPAEAKDRLGFAEVAVTRANDPALRESFLFTRGTLNLELGAFPAALGDADEALRSVAARGAMHTPPAVLLMNLRMRILFAMGKNSEALALAKELVELHTELLGPEHIRLAKSLNNLAIALEKASIYDEAVELHRRALAIKEKTLGPDDASVAVTLHNLGTVYYDQGRAADAIAVTKRALEIREKALGPNHALVASSLTNLSSYSRDAGRYEEALALANRALAIKERINGPDHVQIAYPLISISVILSDLGRGDESLAFAERARAIREKALGPNAMAVGMVWGTVAKAQEVRGDHAAACAAFDRAAEIIEKELGADSSDMVDPLIGQASCHLAAHRLDLAGKAAQKAIAIVEARQVSALAAIEPRYILAQVLWVDPAQRGRAVAEVEKALAASKDAPEISGKDAVKLEAWLRTHRLDSSR